MASRQDSKDFDDGRTGKEVKMNKVMLIGRLTRDAETRYGGANGDVGIARFTMAIDRISKEKATDYISCVAFGKHSATMDKYGKKGKKFGIEGHIQTGSYKDKDGKTVYTTDVIVDRIDFCDASADKAPTESAPPIADGFLDAFEDNLFN